MTQKLTHHPLLNKHTKLGIDIDSTLINGPCSGLLQRWVWEHYQDLDLHLVTFRYGADFSYIERDILEHGLNLNMFKGVHGIDRELAMPFWLLQNKVGFRIPESEDKNAMVRRAKWLRGLGYAKSSEDEFLRLHASVADWKGLKCKELGLTALVDDLEDMVLPGCTTHGVEWINALTL